MFREMDLGPADRAGARAAARHGAAARRRPLGRRGGGRRSTPGRGRLDDGRVLGGVRRRPAAAARSRGAPRPAGARGTRLAILSNWPLATTIDRYAEAAGWSPFLAAIVVSQRVGTIKPHPAIFEAARAALGDPPPRVDPARRRRLGGGRGRGRRAGWRAAYLRARPRDSPLPGSAARRRIDARPGAPDRRARATLERTWTAGRPAPGAARR